MAAGYFGPEGTFTHEALLRATGGGAGAEGAVALSTIHDTVIAVRDGAVARAIVPIENSTEGAVNATLDTLAVEAHSVAILGELVLPIHQCLIARRELRTEDIEVVVSHPQATGQCRTFLRTALPHARLHAASSTAEAVRTVTERDEPWAALGNRLAAELYGGLILLSGVQDAEENETRFVWLGPVGSPAGLPGEPAVGAGSGAGVGASAGSVVGAGADVDAGAGARAWKTAIVFWGAGAEAAGWLVRCLSELAFRGVNLTRIESRPRKSTLGRYMFFVDLDGAADDPPVADALAALRERVHVLHVLGSFPAAARPSA